MRRITIALLWIAFMSRIAQASEETPNRLELEGDLSWNTRNTVQSPVDEGTKFHFDDLGDGPYTNFRFTYERELAPRHELRFVYAPLRIQNQGQFQRDVSFENETYPSGQGTQGNYQFHTYRMSYRYELYQDESRFLKLGGTILVRDAEIRLSDGIRSSKTLNLGIVPLIHFSLGQKILPSTQLVLEGDGLAAPQGSAVDLWAGVRQELTKQSELGIGYRFLDGGADNDSVYTFSTFHSLAVQFALKF